ncbi:MAG: HlyD family efflux transporter periplasmic adaptor subunit [Verrucomicrobia bacterium]|nr:HlyD family efflux transporter periplasmic adaptor subunit [Verrucomicrobiota bacterium]MBI3868837.1 HlyD family efflux transporter periplasmic adaptor subunit [Verrucomicrobiota bacterium]
MKLDALTRGLLTGLALIAQSGCERPSAGRWQGYFEGEFVYVSAALPGRLEKLAVQRGQSVEAGAPLFSLERAAELAAQREADSRHSQALARLEDARKGLRPTEIAALEARLSQARTATDLSARRLERVEKVQISGTLAEDERDRARLTHLSNQQATRDLESQLATARLGGREDAIRAAEAEVAAAQAALDKAVWSVDQKSINAKRGGWIHDTLYREGEFVSASQPIVSLLPPENLKVRFFVSEADYASLKMGDTVQVQVTGRPAPLPARVNYLSLKPEYTPPVLYNRENRAKLVFMIEAAPLEAAAAATFHPGQPVEVSR